LSFLQFSLSFSRYPAPRYLCFTFLCAISEHSPRDRSSTHTRSVVHIHCAVSLKKTLRFPPPPLLSLLAINRICQAIYTTFNIRGLSSLLKISALGYDLVHGERIPDVALSLFTYALPSFSGVCVPADVFPACTTHVLSFVCASQGSPWPTHPLDVDLRKYPLGATDALVVHPQFTVDYSWYVS
jgi:hypothetical protein